MTLCIAEGLVEELSRCLELDELDYGQLSLGVVTQAGGTHIFWGRQYWWCIYFVHRRSPDRRSSHNPGPFVAETQT